MRGEAKRGDGGGGGRRRWRLLRAGRSGLRGRGGGRRGPGAVAVAFAGRGGVHVPLAGGAGEGVRQGLRGRGPAAGRDRPRPGRHHLRGAAEDDQPQLLLRPALPQGADRVADQPQAGGEGLRGGGMGWGGVNLLPHGLLRASGVGLPSTRFSMVLEGAVWSSRCLPGVPSLY